MKLKSTVTVPAGDLKTAQDFAQACWWDAQCEPLFGEDLTIDLPYAPPGMYQHLGANEKKFHFDWMRRTTSGWKWTNIRTLGTDRDGYFWVFRDGEADTCWNEISGHFKSKFAALLQISGGKIHWFKEFSDPTAWYTAIGTELPHFYFDRKDPAEFPPRTLTPANLKTQADLDAQVQDTLAFFKSPNYWDPKVNEVLSEDFLHELTFAPADMQRFYRGQEYDSLNEWLDRHLLGGDIFDEVFYETTDPHIYITEYNCRFTTNWGLSAQEIAAGKTGTYVNREVSYIELDDEGRCLRLDEYLNTMSKFLSIGVSIPTFPYLQ